MTVDCRSFVHSVDPLIEHLFRQFCHVYLLQTLFLTMSCTENDTGIDVFFY